VAAPLEAAPLDARLEGGAHEDTPLQGAPKGIPAEDALEYTPPNAGDSSTASVGSWQSYLALMSAPSEEGASESEAYENEDRTGGDDERVDERDPVASTESMGAREIAAASHNSVGPDDLEDMAGGSASVADSWTTYMQIMRSSSADVDTLTTQSM
jgi:hypothetical protein